MHRVKVLAEKRISDINDEINTAVQISVEKNKGRLEAELLEKAIEDWRKEELEKVMANPSAYAKSSNSQNMNS